MSGNRKEGDKSLFGSQFIEPLVFEFLLDQYDKGNERVIGLIRDAVLSIQVDEVA